MLDCLPLFNRFKVENLCPIILGREPMGCVLFCWYYYEQMDLNIFPECQLVTVIVFIESQIFALGEALQDGII